MIEEWKALDKQVEYDEQKYYEKLKKKSFEEGHTEGYELGVEQGIEQGIEQSKLKIAKSLINKDVSIDIIESATGLTKEEIEELM